MEFKPGLTVGIDLGTTFSTLAHLDAEGNPVPIANDDDEVETPSLILLAGNGHVVVGPSRTRAAVEDPQNVVERVKRHMGNTEFKRTFDGREITPEFLSALILKKLRQDAEQRIGPIGNAVITVPYYFNDSRRKATEDAGRIAGLHVIDIINEPTAATLTYAWKRGELGSSGAQTARPRSALVYDLGGGTFDVTVVRYTPAHFQVLATDGDVQLGGVDWNDRLVDHVAKEFESKHGVDPRTSPATLQLLRHDCDQAKIALSNGSQTSVTVRHEGKALAVTITREQFQDMTADLLQRTLDTTEQVIEQAKIKPSELDAIVMVGGSTLMPKVVEAIGELTGQQPYQGISPHTSVAQGAAIHAAILEAKYRGDADLSDRTRKLLRNVVQEDVNSHGLGVAAKNPKSGKMINKLMIARNSRLPIEVKKVFVTSEPNQRRVNIKVLEGDAPDPDACSVVGNCRITDLPPGLPKGSPIEVVYAFDTSGRIRVRASEQAGGREATIEIERRGGLSGEQVDSLVQLAADYKVEQPMAKTVDVYRDWLQIQEPARPLSYYQLLRLKQFEDNTAKIRDHYRKMNAHVRKFAAGEYAQQSQDLLNELAKAMLCLTDTRRKAEYDASQGRKQAADGKQRTLEEILLAQQQIDTAQLAKARNFAKAVGLDLPDALMQQKIAKPEVVMPAYAESIGLPYLDLADLDLDPALIQRVPGLLARQHSCVPVMVDANQLLMASSSILDPHVEEELRLRLGLSVRTVLCTPAAIHAMVMKHYPRDGSEPAPAPVAASAPQPAAAAAAPAKEAKPAKAPESAEDRKNRTKIALVVFNFTSMVCIFVIFFSPKLYGLYFAGSAVMTIGFSIFVGAVVGGITWAIAGAMRK